MAVLTTAVAMSAITLMAAGCSGSSSSSASSAASSQAATAKLSVTDLTSDFSAMAKLKDIAAQGKGKIAVLLPDTTSSARYTSFDAPYLTKAFEQAGLKSSQFSIQNAGADDNSQLTQAQSALTGGATVLIVDPLDSGVGAQIEKLADQKGAKVIDYDRLTLGGTRSYYVSFDNVKVGETIGQGMVDCLKAWKVTEPKLIEMKGADTDNNATLFQQGYDKILDQNKISVLVKTPGTWNPPDALTYFQQAYTANPTANAVLVPNDDNAAPIINAIKSMGKQPGTFPVTGQDASLAGLQNTLLGYQCGTAYKPIYLEAQATVGLALYLNAGLQPPADLVNGSTKDTQANASVQSVLLSPTWVTTENMKSTVVADNAVDKATLCAGDLASKCKQFGIS